AGEQREVACIGRAAGASATGNGEWDTGRFEFRRQGEQHIAGSSRRDDEPYDVLFTLPAKLEAAGIPFAIASGTRTGGSSNARHLTLFAGIAAAHGLDREAAYRSVTLYPARILGVDHVLGSIAVGKSASFVLTDGDLLEPASTIEQVWIDGVRPSMDDSQKAAYRKWASRPRIQSPRPAAEN
ncbi:MAG: amidohydrolase family protein, partial [Gammaproteobacteria bacterium]|nr:amidohydrolase family protein [Gammaproteobacteria bacterium]